MQVSSFCSLDVRVLSSNVILGGGLSKNIYIYMKVYHSEFWEFKEKKINKHCLKLFHAEFWEFRNSETNTNHKINHAAYPGSILLGKIRRSPVNLVEFLALVWRCWPLPRLTVPCDWACIVRRTGFTNEFFSQKGASCKRESWIMTRKNIYPTIPFFLPASISSNHKPVHDRI